MTLQQMFRDYRRLYHPGEAYVHARSLWMKRELINETWSSMTTWLLIERPRAIIALPN